MKKKKTKGSDRKQKENRLEVRDRQHERRKKREARRR